MIKLITLLSKFIRITWYQEPADSPALCMSPKNELNFSENSETLFSLW